MHPVSLLTCLFATGAVARSLPHAHKHLHARQNDPEDGVSVVYTTVVMTNMVTATGGSGASASQAGSFQPVNKAAQNNPWHGGGRGFDGGDLGDQQPNQQPSQENDLTAMAPITSGPVAAQSSHHSSTTSSASAAQQTASGGDGDSAGSGSEGSGSGGSGGSGSITIPAPCNAFTTNWASAPSAYSGPNTGFTVQADCDGDLPYSKDNATKVDAGDDYVAIHNSYRAYHSVPTMTKDSNAEAAASSYASQCLHGDPGKNSNPPLDGGANYFWQGKEIWSTGEQDTIPVTWATAIYSWYNELANYTLRSNDFAAEAPGGGNSDILHFSQVAWKDTTGVGCAFNSDCSDGGVAHCVYTPGGNVGGGYLDNVMMPKPDVIDNSATTGDS
ncbi:MAG: hypothetical protein Q9162_001950 [Coniocarpon cinnabarinum]